MVESVTCIERDFRLCQNVKTFLMNDRVRSALCVAEGGERADYVKEWDNECVKCGHIDLATYWEDIEPSKHDWIIVFGLSGKMAESTFLNRLHARCTRGVLVLQASAPTVVDRLTDVGFEPDWPTSDHLTTHSSTDIRSYVFRRGEHKKQGEEVEAKAETTQEEVESVDLEDPDSFVQIVYDMCITGIPEPPESKRVFRVPGSNRLGICLIEFRSVRWLRYIVRQIAHVYGGTDASLYIVHGLKNKAFFQSILRGYTNVRLIEYPYDNIDRHKYADICCDPDFYKQFDTEFVLKMEWDSFIRKPIPEEFFKYSYVGAPWLGYPNDVHGGNIFKRLGNKLVGNGGFSLRKVSRMIEVSDKDRERPRNVGEDVFITNRLRDDEIPDVKLASEFSVEFVYNKDPVGLHHVWTIHTPDVVKAWMRS